jgi:glyoxylase-like metal-dependent hydrolase (beta-lactamase superfamily II)
MDGTAPRPVLETAARLFAFRDTCNVYVLRSGREAVLVDFGSGAVLDHLAELGIDRVTDVLVTHHHRDQVQGLARAVAAGARVWVPPFERTLIGDVDEHWQARQLDVDYSLREDRFSLLESVAVTGAVSEYRTVRYGDYDVFTLPTPGHTPGSVSYLVDVEGLRVAFVGDLVYGEGKVWSLAALQWSYSDALEGAASTIMSCALLERQAPDQLLPSHGGPMHDPPDAFDATCDRLRELMALRWEHPFNVDGWLHAPWHTVTPHLLRDRTKVASSYALVSESCTALLFDCGYDLASHRPLLHSTDGLRLDHGVERIEVVVPTHFHDDHVAGINLLREVDGTEVWVPERVAPVLEEPRRYDLPCLWPEPVRADRVLSEGSSFTWKEYQLTVHPLPGHTRYAAAISFEVDGQRVVVTGDQHWTPEGSDPRDLPNFYYRNRFAFDDYVRSAELYASLQPDIMLMGHSMPQRMTPERIDRMLVDGRRLAELHRELLPLEDVDLGAEGYAARIEPYRASLRRGEWLTLAVHVRNPLQDKEPVSVTLAVPRGWAVDHDAHEAVLEPGADAVFTFRVTAPRPARRARVGADVTVGDLRLGQQAEALVDVE